MLTIFVTSRCQQVENTSRFIPENRAISTGNYRPRLLCVINTIGAGGHKYPAAHVRFIWKLASAAAVCVECVVCAIMIDKIAGSHSAFPLFHNWHSQGMMFPMYQISGGSMGILMRPKMPFAAVMTPVKEPE